VQSPLPTTGTAKLLDTLSPFIPDPFINTLLAGRSHPGPRQSFSAAQLWRVHLLALLTPAHSFNALVRLLPEQRDWRRFAHLHHRHHTPDVARRLLGQVRSWIEPCQAYEKNLLGLKRMFLNSLRLTWTLSLLVDAVGLLRAMALLSAPKESSPLEELLPRQMNLRWENEPEA